MPSDSAAKTAILDRVRAANDGAADIETACAAWGKIPRGYDAAPRDHDATIDLLVERLRDYDAEVEVLTYAEIPQKVQAIVATLEGAQVLLPEGIATWLVQKLSNAQIDRNFSTHELDAFSCVVTEATLGIAETGTLVVQNVPGQGRRAASLVPDTHICILRASDVVATVPEAMRRLQNTCTLPTTFISGPSATADIEMTRIKGVHGPRFLHVLIAK
jgi:L-lactate dehydrogenase complex protein LldG